jgi:hypothetical protein
MPQMLKTLVTGPAKGLPGGTNLVALARSYEPTVLALV